MKKSRLELYNELMPLVMKFDMKTIKQYMVTRYRVDDFRHMTVEQVDDFLTFLKGILNVA